jgi:hypothetical protein
MKKKTRESVEIQYQPMPKDFWNHLYNPITGMPYSVRDRSYQNKYHKTHDILKR